MTRSGDNSVSRHGSLAAICRFLTIALSAISSLLVIPLLGPENFGRYSMALAASRILSVFAMFGLDQASIYRLGVDDANGKSHSQSLSLICMTGLISFIGVGIGSFLLFTGFSSELGLSGASTFQILIVVFYLLIFALVRVIGEVRRGQNEPFLANVFGGVNGGPVASICFLLTIVIVACFQRVTWDLCLLVWCLSLLVSAVALILPSLSRTNTLTRNDLPTLVEFYHFSIKLCLPFFIITLAGIAAEADVLLLGNFLSSEESVAYYAAAKRLVMLVVVPLQVANLSIISQIAKLHRQGNLIELERIMRLSSGLAAIPSGGACLLFILFPSQILTLCFGVEYSSAAFPLQCLGIAQLVFTLTGPCKLALMQTNRARVPLIVTTCTMIVVASLSYWVASTYGATGFAVLISSGIIVENVINWWMCRYYVGVYSHPDLRMLTTLISSRKSWKSPKDNS